eukprot:749821-Hanusia_phi.AAC.1
MAEAGVAVDQALMAYLKDVDEYQTSMAEVVAACKAGMFELARARKSMGFKGCAVSQLQYPSRMKATRKIEFQEGDEEISETNAYGEGFVMFSRAVETVPEKSEEEEPVCTDPIKWFGILVPSSLRASQKNFIRAVEGAAAASAANMRMQKDYQRFRHLLSCNKKITG